jgi:1-acyl-sn-glycerol-3-phosphate acyltransferase
VKSRSAAKDEIRRQLQLYKKRVIIFPSGTTSIKVEEKWKSGVFQLAKELGVRIQPLRISYSHLRQVAYIDDDFFPVHLWKLGKNSGYEARVEFHPPLIVDDVGAAVEYCRSWSNSHNKDLSFVTSKFESEPGSLNQSLT